MKHPRSTLLGWLALCLPLALALNLSAETPASPLDVSIEAFVVTVDEDGEEQVQSATEAVPDATILYRATYRNTGDRTLKNILPRIPVPTALVYLEGSASPLPTTVSVDGVAFEAYEPSAVEASEAEPFKALQWSLAELAPGEVFVAEFRARIPTE